MINEDMYIKEITRKYPGTKRVLMYYDLLATGCG
jgi:hypothetical protein